MTRAPAEWLTLDQAALVRAFDACLADDDLGRIRERVVALRDNLPMAGESGGVTLRRDVLLAELAQILETRTLSRTHYYLKRLHRGVTEVRTGKVNDINLNRWKEYDDLYTDSLWLLERRDSSGAHSAWYWGNFVPQIPHQLLRRYTKPGEWVLDAFAGSGTTLIEAVRLGRHSLGVELNPEVATKTRETLAQVENPHGVTARVVEGDSAALDYAAVLADLGIAQVQLLLLHPPYHDIIRFSEDDRDLSNAASVDDFVAQFACVVERATPCLETGRYLAVVIGDKYARGEWIPLGFYLMQAVLEQGYTLKSIVVKNFEETRAKREQKELWRYRALVGGFYIFKHEYILLFQK